MISARSLISLSSLSPIREVMNFQFWKTTTSNASREGNDEVELGSCINEMTIAMSSLLGNSNVGVPRIYFQSQRPDRKYLGCLRFNCPQNWAVSNGAAFHTHHSTKFSRCSRILSFDAKDTSIHK